VSKNVEGKEMKFFYVKGKKYLLNDTKEGKNHEMKLELVPFNQDEYEELVDDIVDAMEKAVDKRILIQEALSGMPYNEIKRMHKSISKGVKAKASRGCYKVSVGKTELFLVG
jgi:hypothetical protein